MKMTIHDFLSVVSPYNEIYLYIVDNDFENIEEGYAEDIDNSALLSGLCIDTIISKCKNSYTIVTEETTRDIFLRANTGLVKHSI